MTLLEYMNQPSINLSDTIKNRIRKCVKNPSDYEALGHNYNSVTDNLEIDICGFKSKAKAKIIVAMN